LKRKNFFLFTLVLLIIIWMTVSIFSAQPQNPELNAVGVNLNGAPIKIDTICAKDDLYVPVEQICYYLNCSYVKDDAEKKIDFIKNGQTVQKPQSIDFSGTVKKKEIKVENSGYQTMLEGLLLFIEPVVYDNTFYINLKYLAQSFEKETSWGFLKRSLKVTDYPASQ
jgi:hypothetical protein